MKMLMAGLAVVRKEGNINNEKTVFLATSCSESIRNQRVVVDGRMKSWKGSGLQLEFSRLMKYK